MERYQNLLCAGCGGCLGYQHPMAVLRRRAHPGGDLLRALFSLTFAVQIAEPADAYADIAVAIQLRGEVRSDGADNRPVAVPAVPFPAAHHHATAQTADAKAGGSLGTIDCVHGVVYFGDQPAGLRLCLVSQRQSWKNHWRWLCLACFCGDQSRFRCAQEPPAHKGVTPSLCRPAEPPPSA